MTSYFPGDGILSLDNRNSVLGSCLSPVPINNYDLLWDIRVGRFFGLCVPGPGLNKDYFDTNSDLFSFNILISFAVEGWGSLGSWA